MSNDLIKREDALQALVDSDVRGHEYRQLEEAIKDIPSADRPSAVDLSSVYSTAYKNRYKKGKADRPQGEWIPFEYGDERWHKCTACGVADKYIEYVERPNGTTGKLVAIRNYCPNCGARMKGADDDRV